MTISPFNSLLQRRFNELKALKRWVAGHIKVGPQPVEEVRFSEQVKALPRYPRKVIVLHYVDDMSAATPRPRGGFGCGLRQRSRA